MASLSKSSRNGRSASPLFRSRLFIAVLFIIVSASTSTGPDIAWDPQNCPRFCRCFLRYDLRWADCSGRRLYSVETGVNRTVQALDLFNNSVSSLANHELRYAGLENLKLLNLSSNAIKGIGLTAFGGLSELRVLDLSKNHLYSILPDTFVNNKKLGILGLAGNNFNRWVPKLRSSSLGSLDLSNCRMGHLPSDAFDGLPRLRALDLTDNMMIQLEMDVFKELPSLKVLMIERNPWSCNDNMYELQKRLRERRIDFEEVCNESESPSSKIVPRQKLEKMIAPDRKPVNPKSERPSGRLLVKIKNWKNSLKSKSTLKICQQSSVSNVSSNVPVRHDASIYPGFAAISPFCFLAIGFLIGSAISATLTYLCLARSPRRPRELLAARGAARTEASDIANQRVNLLQHLCQSNEEVGRSMSQCPGTPPPPYRDVILYASRYPRPNVRSSLGCVISESNRR